MFFSNRSRAAITYMAVALICLMPNLRVEAGVRIAAGALKQIPFHAVGYTATQTGGVYDSKSLKQKEKHKALPKTLKEIKKALTTTRDVLSGSRSNQTFDKPDPAGEAAVASSKKVLKELNKTFKQLHAEAMKDFDRDRRLLVEKKVNGLFLKRHDKARDNYLTRAELLISSLDQMERESDTGRTIDALTPALALLEDNILERTPQANTPDHLPFGAPSLLEQMPRTTTDGLNKRLATAGEFLPDPAPMIRSAPTAADLAETPEVAINQEIRDLASSLNHDPVVIYNWVHDNIIFHPSYGSIQGSVATLHNMRGNAFDTSSLLIALLRASGIHARYAYGAVDIPTDQALNWLGDLDNVDAAATILGQGGIPNTEILVENQVAFFRMEHVWVEAFVDFSPSRGARHVTGDTWTPMDAAFKQYAFSEPLDLVETLGFDTDAAGSAIVGATGLNGNSITMPDREMLQGIVDDLAQKAADYQAANPTANDKPYARETIIPSRGLTQLTAGLPYTHIATTARFSEVPDSLRLRFRYQLSDEYGNTLFTFNEPTVVLAEKDLAVSFEAATMADQDLLASYIPDPENPPQSVLVPGYLVSVKPQFTVDGQVMAESSSMNMGRELKVRLGYWEPGRGWYESDNTLVAGEYQAVGLNLQGVSNVEYRKLVDDLEFLQAAIQNQDITGMSRHQLSGIQMQAVIKTYHYYFNILKRITPVQNMITYQQPSYGTYSTIWDTTYFFGIPRNVEAVGALIDVDRLISSTVAPDNNPVLGRSFVQAMGLLGSELEAAIPELFNNFEGQSARGISATRALAYAASTGQQIFTIDSSNLNDILPLLAHESHIKSEIAAAVNAGLVVTVHSDPISRENFTGAGYIMTDPVTGAADYRINGGASGGWLALFLGVTLSITALLAVLVDAAGTEALGLIFAAWTTAVGITNIIVQCFWAATVTGDVSYSLFGVLLSVFWALMVFIIFAFGAASGLGPILLAAINALAGTLLGLFVDWVLAHTCAAAPGPALP